MQSLFQELKRRNVYRVAATYAVVAFVTLQAAKLIFPATTLEGLYDKLVVVAFVGFPIALVIAWAFELTPEGVRRTEAPEGEQVAGSPAYQWVALALVAVLAGGVWYATAGDGGEAPPETTATRDTTAARMASTSPDTAGPPRIAVLPFENIARDTGDAFFAEGMHEEVLNQLSKVSGLEVISRTSVMGYADTDKRIPVISEELGGVDALMEGTVRRAGNRVRITIQLIAAPEDEHLWSNTYERALSVEGIFDIQADIAEQIAGSLKTQLAEGERRRIEDAPTDNLAAFDAYLRGRNAAMDTWNALDPRHLESAVESLRRAISRDSTFGEAYAWLGFAYASRAGFSGENRWRDSALSLVDHALTLAPDLALSHAVRGFAYQLDSLAVAEEAYERALELQPNQWLAADGMADLAVYRGNYAEAVEWSHRSLRLNPRWEYGLAFMGRLLRRIGMFDAAASWYRRVREMNPENILAVGGLTYLHLSRGNVARARETVSSYRSQLPDHPLGSFLAAEIALRRENPERALRLLDEIPQGRGAIPTVWHSTPSLIRGLAEVRAGRTDRGHRRLQTVADSIRRRLQEVGSGWYQVQGHAMLARALAVLGQKDGALQHLEKAMESGLLEQEYLRRDPFFTDVRSDSRFQELLGQMERRQDEFRREVRQLGIDLYPPGVEPDSSSAAAGG